MDPNGTDLKGGKVLALVLKKERKKNDDFEMVPESQKTASAAMQENEHPPLGRAPEQAVSLGEGRFQKELKGLCREKVKHVRELT